MKDIFAVYPENTPCTFYVYLHRALTDLRPIYVGKGKGRRYRRFDHRNYLWNRVAENEGILVQILQQGITEDQAYDLEIALIKHYGKIIDRSGTLVNLADGGPDKPERYK